MFHKPVDTVTTPQRDVDLMSELVPLSVLALDLPAPASGWATYLSDRDISITIDDIGRAAVARADARRLLTEQRETESRNAERRAAAEQAAVEADQLRRAQMGAGVPASAIPHGMSPAEALFAAELDSQVYRPRRSSVVEDLLDNGGLTFHSFGPPPEE